MNKLSFGLLSLLSTESQTGYELMIKLNLFWHTNHSAIYPLLSELEEKGYVNFYVQEQKGKPDKKIYNISEEGVKILKEWITSPVNDPVIKDEMMLKIYCFEVLNKETVEKLLDEMEHKATNDLNKYLKILENFKAKVNGNLNSNNAPKFGAYLLIQKKISDTKLKIKWYQWIKDMYDKDKTLNILDNNFEDFNNHS